MHTPADSLEAIAQSLMTAGAGAARSFSREWAVPTVTAQLIVGTDNPLAGGRTANLRYHQYGVGWDGTNTFLPFTAGVSFIEATGLSDDIVVGS